MLKIIEFSLHRQVFTAIVLGHLLVVALKFGCFRELGRQSLDFFLMSGLKGRDSGLLDLKVYCLEGHVEAAAHILSLLEIVWLLKRNAAGLEHVGRVTALYTVQMGMEGLRAVLNTAFPVAFKQMTLVKLTATFNMIKRISVLCN